MLFHKPRWRSPLASGLHTIYMWHSLLQLQPQWAQHWEIKPSTGEDDVFQRHGIHRPYRPYEAAAGPTAHCFTINSVRSRDTPWNRSTVNTEARSSCLLLLSTIAHRTLLCGATGSYTWLCPLCAPAGKPTSTSALCCDTGVAASSLGGRRIPVPLQWFNSKAVIYSQSALPGTPFLGNWQY